MAVSQLGYIGIGVSDMAVWEKFATEILGLQIADRSPDGCVYLRMDEYCYRIILHPTGEDDIIYVGLLAKDEEEYLATLASLEGAGVELTKPSGEELAVRRVRDMLQFNASNIPFEIAFGAPMEYRNRFVPGRPMSGFTAGSLGLGHVVLSIDDPQAAHVILKAAGFRVTDMAGPAVFLRCNPRHHSIATGPSRLFAMQGMTKKLNHVMLETRELDDVGRAIDLCGQAGHPMPAALGKHNNDHMVSFYVETPSGFEIEYGWAGRLIDEDTWQVVYYPGDDVWGHGRPQWGGKSQPPRPKMPPGGMPPGGMPPGGMPPGGMPPGGMPPGGMPPGAPTPPMP